jgi:hypothetical protein
MVTPVEMIRRAQMPHDASEQFGTMIDAQIVTYQDIEHRLPRTGVGAGQPVSLDLVPLLRQKMLTAPALNVIIAAYRNALTSYTSQIRDASQWPYPKNKIKGALLVHFTAVENTSIRKQLRAEIISLAAWQDTSLPKDDVISRRTEEARMLSDEVDKLQAVISKAQKRAAGP